MTVTREQRDELRRLHAEHVEANSAWNRAVVSGDLYKDRDLCGSLERRRQSTLDDLRYRAGINLPAILDALDAAEAAAFRAGLEAGARIVEQPPCPDTRQDVAAAIRAMPLPEGEVADDMPNEVMREVGTAWLEQYGDDPDKAFVAAAVYRVMRQAKRTPDHYELAALRAARGQP